MKQMTLSTLTAVQAFVILWSDQPHIRRLAYSAGQQQPRSDRGQGRRGSGRRTRHRRRSRLNPSEGITHGYGKNLVVDALRKLLHAGYVIDEPGLEAAGFAAGLR